MSARNYSFSYPNTPLVISETVNHCVRRYTGDPHELVRKMQTEKRSGIILIHISQGSIFKMTFDTRLKDSA